MKKIRKSLLALSFIVIAGCTGGSKTAVSFDGLQMNISADYISVSTAQLDNFQIINKILKAYKFENQTLIVARSALTSTVNVQEYATTSKEKLALSIPGYEHIDDSMIRFTCGDEKLEGYTHSFAIADTQGQDNPGKTYIIQYYFIAQGTPYIISQADRTSSHYSDFTSILNSLHCN